MPDTRGAKDLTTNYPLDKANHGSPELHKIGQALLDPSYVAPIPYATTGTVGQSDEIARADHVHAFPQQAMDGITGSQSTADQALAVANANTAGAAAGAAVSSQLNTPLSFMYFNPLRFNSSTVTMGSGLNQFYYIRQGPMVDVFASWGVANDSVYANGALQVWVPVGMNNVSSLVPCGFLRMEDSGGSQYQYYPIPIASGAGYTVFQFINATHTAFASNPGGPMTWTAGDVGRGAWRYYGA